MKIYISIWTKEDGSEYEMVIRNKKPREYMGGWSFERLLNYIKEELEWEDVNPSDVQAINIGVRGSWCQTVNKEDR